MDVGDSVEGGDGVIEDFEKRAASRLLVFVREAAATAAGAALAVLGRDIVEARELRPK